MRFWGTKATPQVPVAPDTVLSLLLTAATAQAFDYPTGCDLVRVTPGSTATGFETIYFNPASTAATVPTTAGAVTTASSGLNIAVSLGDSKMFQIPGGSTGFSLVSVSSLAVSVEFWSRAG